MKNVIVVFLSFSFMKGIPKLESFLMSRRDEQVGCLLLLIAYSNDMITPDIV